MKKIILNIFVFLFLSHYGFSPIYSKNNNQNFDLNIISIKGDRLINNSIISNLNRNKNDQTTNKFDIEIATEYEKIINSKDKTGATSSYQLKASSEFNIKNENFNERVTFTEKFIMDKNENLFDEKNYERTIKKSFASSISGKIILKLNSIK